jgi:hypothetical protein
MPTIKIGDNEYSGKNHGEAMDAAIAAGEDIPDKDTPEGKEWRKENGMFKDSNGELLTREKAKEEYGIGNSEDLSDNKVVKEVAANNEINDTQIIPTFNQIKLKIPESDLAATEDIVNKVNNAESININDLNKGQDGLYAALEAHPEAAHLIEPLITKIQNYEFTTKTEISTVTERKPIEGSFKNKSKSEIKPALEKSIGGKVTITNADGTKVEGILNLENGNYVVVNENGDKVSAIGEKAINDRDLKLPTEEEMPEPIEFDKDGRVKSVTFKTKDGKFISIDNSERALDIAIQLQADAIGIIPDAAFEQAYTEVQTEISKEVPLNDEKNKNTKDTKPTTEKIEPIKGTDKVVEQTGEGKKEQPILITNKTESNDKSKEGSKKADAEKSTEKNDAEKTNVADTGVVDEEAAPLSDVSENNVDENDPLEVSLQRDRLMKDVADAFYKPSDGSRSIADRAVLEGAVKTISREATNAGKSISEHLQSKVDNWYKSLFDATGKRLLDKNGREKQILLSDEQQAMIAIHKLNLERKIRESKTNPASIFDAADLSKMQQQVKESDYVAGVVGESVGRALRSQTTILNLK